MADNIYAIESPIKAIAGEQKTYTLEWKGATTIGSPAVTVYKSGEDITSTAAPGTASVNGNSIELPAITFGANDGGSKYVVVVQASVDDNTEKRKIVIEVVKPEVVA